jgi:predicted unusual protein kinase regulating ubiquinone biosynthesis (AarF/ABC1/UbiB family)
MSGKGPFDTGNAHDLAHMLGSLRGPLMKVAQVAGGLPDVFPPEFAQELAKLQSSAPPMGTPFVRRRMAAELGPDWQRMFKSFDLKPAHAASLGQVHKAMAHDGRPLACKLQYPDMKSAVDADLTQLKTVLVLQRAAERKIDTSEIAREVEERILEELDYAREAKHMRLFRVMLRDQQGITTPEPRADLSTGRLLTMTWLEGVSFQDALREREKQRESISAALFLAWWLPLFRFGVIHGDAHLGNYTVTPDGGINLLDFGCVRIVAPRVVEGLIDLYRSLSTDDPALAAQGYEKWGFANVTPDLVAKMDVWARMVFGPMLEDRRRVLGDGSPLARDGAPQMQVLWDLKQKLRQGGVVKPPREFVFIARAVVGIGAALVQLDAKLNWHRMFASMIGGFDTTSLAERQAQACREAGLT